MFDFSEALKWLKMGKKVARKGWNGKGMWISLSHSPDAASGVRYVTADQFWSANNKAYALQLGGSAPVLPCITMKTADDKILMGWLASQTDLLAEDWVLID